MNVRCSDCGALHPDGMTCQDDFYQMLYWEAETPSLGAVHHLMVLCYFLQHPGLYSPAGLLEGRRLLADFLECGLSPQDVRQRERKRLNSQQRTFNIQGKPGQRGAYQIPPTWTMTASDVVAAGPQQYCDQVRAWAQSVRETLKDTPW